MLSLPVRLISVLVSEGLLYADDEMSIEAIVTKVLIFRTCTTTALKSVALLRRTLGFRTWRASCALPNCEPGKSTVEQSCVDDAGERMRGLTAVGSLLWERSFSS